ncbi:MAG: response regulator [Cellulosilyticaceae bacterium]
MNLQEMKIVVSDNSVLMRKRLKESIKALGVAHVYEATDGQQVIALYKAHQPQIVFMDIMMPIKTGLEATRELIAYDPQAYIVIVTPNGVQNKLKEVLEAGASTYLKKPVQEEAVQELITRYRDEILVV